MSCDSLRKLGPSSLLPWLLKQNALTLNITLFLIDFQHRLHSSSDSFLTSLWDREGASNSSSNRLLFNDVLKANPNSRGGVSSDP